MSFQPIVTSLTRRVRCLRNLRVLALPDLLASIESESATKVLALLKHFFSQWRTCLVLTVVICLLSDLRLQCIQLSIKKEMGKVRRGPLCVCVDKSKYRRLQI